MQLSRLQMLLVYDGLRLHCVRILPKGLLVSEKGILI